MAILDTARTHSRQFVQVAEQAFDFSQLVDATAVPAVKIPANARVIGGGLIIETVFNSATSDTIDVGDGGDPDRYSATPIDATALGYTALDLTGYKYTTTDWIDLVWDGTGTAPTTGAGRLVVMYVIDGNSNAGVMPDYD